jgi:predicted DNA-binding transcriptional regulator AlpA
MDKLLTEKQVTEIVGFKKTKLYQMIKKGTFPAPKKIWKS